MLNGIDLFYLRGDNTVLLYHRGHMTPPPHTYTLCVLKRVLGRQRLPDRLPFPAPTPASASARLVLFTRPLNPCMYAFMQSGPSERQRASPSHRVSHDRAGHTTRHTRHTARWLLLSERDLAEAMPHPPSSLQGQTPAAVAPASLEIPACAARRTIAPRLRPGQARRREGE